jgi:phosphoglycerol transferase MdoB-like AlkP superfamily enzyme
MKLSFRHYYFRWTKNLFFLVLIVLAMMSIARGTFAFIFGDVVNLTDNLSAVGQAMLLGMRYDLMPLAYINVVPFLLLNIAYFFPGKFTIRVTRFLIISILCLGYFSLGWIYVFDYGFYSFFQDHLNVLFFGFFEDDTIALIISIWKNYNAPLWLAVILFLHFGFYRFTKFLFSPFEFDLKVKRFDWKMPGIFLSGLVAVAFAGRGNFTRLPLSIEDAHISSNEFINKLSVNGAISLNRALKIRKTFGKGNYNYLKQYGFSNWKEAYVHSFNKSSKSSSLFKALKHKTPHNPVLEERTPHVVLVVMESFGTYWNSFDDKNFNVMGDLKKHFKEDILFKNFLPAENGTIGSIVSIATSQVIRPGARFLSESEFMKTSLRSSGHLPYKEQGYDTHFIYGGKLGWRDLGKYLRLQNYDYLWGADEIKEAMPELSNISKKDLGNEWGIFDEYLYSFLEERLRTATKPQFFLVLTTSNHPPFEVPSTYEHLKLELNDKIKEKITASEDIAHKRFSALQYGNQKMAEFLNRTKSSSLKENVVVALTGDHSYWIARGVGLEEEFKRYAVPFYLSVPEDLKPQSFDRNKFGSHEDIFPTLYHLTLSNQEYIKLGENMLGEDSKATNSTGLVANKFGAYHHDQYWKWKNLEDQILEPTGPTEELQALKLHHKALISITDLYLKEEKKRKQIVEGSDQQ